MKLSALSLKLIPLLVAFDPTLVMANDFQSKAQAAFAPIVQEFNVPGLIVGITRDGVHEFYATGLASREQQSPVTPDTLLNLAPSVRFLPPPSQPGLNNVGTSISMKQWRIIFARTNVQSAINSP